MFLLFFVCVFILNKSSILTISYAYIISATAEGLLAIIVVWRYFSKFFLKLNFEICKEILINVWPFGLITISTTIYYYFNSVILGILRSNEEVGWYNAAFKTAFFITAVTGVLFYSFFLRFPDLLKKISINSEALTIDMPL